MTPMVANEMALLESLGRLDRGTFAHSVRTRDLALRIGKGLGLDGEDLRKLALGSFLHDIGKHRVPLDLLQKQTPLTEGEWLIIQDHTVLGFEAVQSAGLPHDVARIVLEHHRWANGQGGYPGHVQEPPTLLTQIVSVADVLDAMTSKRPYRPAQPVGAALEFVYQHKGTRFSSTVVDCLRSNMEDIKELITHEEGEDL